MRFLLKSLISYTYIMSVQNNEPEIDYLEVDKPIPGQNYVCMSFVSPEKVLEDKNHYFVKEFLKSLNKDFEETDLENKYEQYMNTNKEELQKNFDINNGGKTSIRGIKIRGIYDTRREAEVRAKVLQRMDKSFHVYVGQVGYWLPWDPNPDNVENQEYAEKELNNLVKSYKDNEGERDIYYQEQLSKRKEEIRKENDRIKQENSKLNEDTGNNQDQQDNTNGVRQEEILDKIMNTEDHSELKQEFEKYKTSSKDVKEI